jgi:hypothetical protein
MEIGEVVRTPVERNMGSRKTIALVGAWLKACMGAHEACMFGWNPKWKPIRLLELDYTVGPSKVRLQAQFSPADLLYMTLSHGWGSSSSQRLILTRDTLGALREGVTIQTLPQTVRDAVRLARRLGGRYI